MPETVQERLPTSTQEGLLARAEIARRDNRGLDEGVFKNAAAILDSQDTLIADLIRERDEARALAWQPAATAPKDGTHILVCAGPYNEHWTFDQKPPVVVHYWDLAGEEGFYLSSGLVDGSYNDVPVSFSHWMRLVPPEARALLSKGEA